MRRNTEAQIVSGEANLFDDNKNQVRNEHLTKARERMKSLREERCAFRFQKLLD